MKPLETILIHAGSGAVGLAAITIALHMNCTVFTTVGSPEKRNYIKNKFPQIQDKNIGNSRDTTFEEKIMLETGGKGVDVVLNSLADDKFLASLRCVGYGGRFVEIGVADMFNNTPIGASLFLKNCTFYGVILEQELETGLGNDGQFEEFVRSGIVKPINSTIFKPDQVEQAFRFLATSKHIGKVLVKISEDEASLNIETMLVEPRTFMSPSKSYIVVGGLGGLGLELTDWLITRGATKIVLNSRNPVVTGYQSYCLRIWRSRGVDVRTTTYDTITLNGATSLVNFANNLGQVGGIFNAALVIRDKQFKEQSEESFREVIQPKWLSTKNLDTVSRQLCSDLHLFIAFSSMASGIGNATQTNYGYANSTLERICEDRRNAGLPAIAMQFGPIDDVGYFHRMKNETIGSNMRLAGILPQTIKSCLNALDYSIQQDTAIVSSVVVGHKTMEQVDEKSIQRFLYSAFNIKDVSLLDNTATLRSFGLDSLMIFEIKQFILRSFGVDIPVADIGKVTVGQIKEMHKKSLSA